MNSKCIIILSTKSAGSSACQNFLVRNTKARHVTKTRHYESETLYWTKAASILDLPQERLLDSEVPIEKNRAKRELLELLRDNLGSYTPPATDEDLIFDGWRQLCVKFGPVFLEKSPHHLHQWSNLELIMRCMHELRGIDFHFVGLIRNPMDTLYSAWTRFNTRPEENQYQWFTAYSNLMQMKSGLGSNLSIVRYEDMTADPKTLQPVLNFVGGPRRFTTSQYFHRDSIARWKADRRFEFRLANRVVDLAKQYGYESDELIHDKETLLRGTYSKLLRLSDRKSRETKRGILQQPKRH